MGSCWKRSNSEGCIRMASEDDKLIGTWRPHRPRGMIGASMKSPGPKYALPGALGCNQHDVRKNVAPAYSFGTRHRQFSSDCSPGPAHFVRPNITRKGRDGTPQYSLYGRHRAIKNLQTPGPGSYVPEKVTNVFSSAPSYSLAARTSGQMTQTSPGPAAYVLSVQIGSDVKTKASAPAYSMSSRKSFGSFSEDLKKTPGPGTYNTTDPSVYRFRQHVYSMTGRNLQPGDSTQKPGPGAHSPEKVKINRRATASYSFGIRHSDYVAPFVERIRNK